MTPSRSTWPARVWRGLLLALVVLTGCGGARRPKISGPPPEYEQPDLPDASFEPPAESRRDASSR